MATMTELGTDEDPRASTFSLIDEDHTLGNSLRYILNQDPRVEFCGYSVPHPSEHRVNIRIQTTGDSAKDVLKDALQQLIGMCQHIRTTFDKSVETHRLARGVGEVSVKSGVTEATTSQSQVSQRKGKGSSC